jgi:hypothetical protein
LALYVLLQIFLEVKPCSPFVASPSSGMCDFLSLGFCLSAHRRFLHNFAPTQLSHWIALPYNAFLSDQLAATFDLTRRMQDSGAALTMTDNVLTFHPSR